MVADVVGASAGASVVWLLVYRMPFARARTRNRVALRLGTLTGTNPDRAFALFATAWYVAFGSMAAILVARSAGIGLSGVFGTRFSAQMVPATLLAALGAMSLTSLGMGLLYTLKPGVDVPRAVSNVAWIARTLSLPTTLRAVAPMCGAMIEETFFRGVVFTGIYAVGGGVWLALAISAGLFTITQVIIAGGGLAALVFAYASVVISFFGCMLVVVFASVLPALIVHAAFAGFYTNMSVDGARP
jgi:hypothetical protein